MYLVFVSLDMVLIQYLKKIAHFLDNVDFFIEYFEYQIKGVPRKMTKKNRITELLLVFV